jgi:transposase
MNRRPDGGPMASSKQAQASGSRRCRRFLIQGEPVPAPPSWLTTPLWDRFAALLPQRGTYHPDHPLGCHRPRVPDRVIFDKLIQVLVFGCGYRKLADQACSATTIRDRRNQWIHLGIFTTLELLVLDAYDRMIGLGTDDLAVDGCITKAPAAATPPGAAPLTAANKAANAPR